MASESEPILEVALSYDSDSRTLTDGNVFVTFPEKTTKYGMLAHLALERQLPDITFERFLHEFPEATRQQFIRARKELVSKLKPFPSLADAVTLSKEGDRVLSDLGNLLQLSERSQASRSS